MVRRRNTRRRNTRRRNTRIRRNTRRRRHSGGRRKLPGWMDKIGRRVNPRYREQREGEDAQDALQAANRQALANAENEHRRMDEEAAAAASRKRKLRAKMRMAGRIALKGKRTRKKLWDKSELKKNWRYLYNEGEDKNMKKWDPNKWKKDWETTRKNIRQEKKQKRKDEIKKNQKAWVERAKKRAHQKKIKAERQTEIKKRKQAQYEKNLAEWEMKSKKNSLKKTGYYDIKWKQCLSACEKKCKHHRGVNKKKALAEGRKAGNL